MVSDKWILTMDKLLSFADKHAKSSIALVFELDETIFQQFMVKRPIWDFNSISKDEYLHMNKGHKEELILNYYTSMKKVEDYIFVVVCLRNYLFILANCFFPNFQSSLKPNN